MSYVSRRLSGLGDSMPAIELKAREYLGKVAALNYLNVYNYSPTTFRMREINGQYIEKSGTPNLGSLPVIVGINDFAPLQLEFFGLLKDFGYEESAARHIAAFTSLSYISPMVVGGGLPSDTWAHAWGTRPIIDALTGNDLNQYKQLRNAVAGNIVEVEAPWTFFPHPPGYYWIPSPGDKDGSRMESKTAYDAFYDFVLQKILFMLQQTARTETAAETAIKTAIAAKFQELLGRAPTATEMSEWFISIRDGGKTIADLDALIRATAEYAQHNAPPPPPPASTKTTVVKKAGILDFLKSPIGLGVAALGVIIIIRQASKKKGR